MGLIKLDCTKDLAALSRAQFYICEAGPVPSLNLLVSEALLLPFIQVLSCFVLLVSTVSSAASEAPLHLSLQNK